jgi:hypothetical protein
MLIARFPVMSTPRVPRSPGSSAPNATKQLLDELDALMERMLALPVNELGDDLSAEATATTDLPEEPASVPSAENRPPELEGRGPEPSLSPKAPAEVVGTRLVSPHPASPSLPPPHWKEEPEHVDALTDTAVATPEPGTLSRAGFWPHPALQAATVLASPVRQEPIQASHPVTPSPRHPVIPWTPARPPQNGWWLRSLLWSNRTFDRYIVWLGPLGRWLHSRGGRKALGWAGLGLLGWAIVWGLSDWLGWTW